MDYYFMSIVPQDEPEQPEQPEQEDTEEEGYVPPPDHVISKESTIMEEGIIKKDAVPCEGVDPLCPNCEHTELWDMASKFLVPNDYSGVPDIQCARYLRCKNCGFESHWYKWELDWEWKTGSE